MSCDWCEGGACDLIIPVKGYENITCELDDEHGICTLRDGNTIIGGRGFYYCPMCGKRFGVKSKEYNRIREEANSWPDWKKEFYNNNCATSAHAKKLLYGPQKEVYTLYLKILNSILTFSAQAQR